MNTGVGSLSFPQGSSQPRNRTGVSCIAGGFFTSWAAKEALLTIYFVPNTAPSLGSQRQWSYVCPSSTCRLDRRQTHELNRVMNSIPGMYKVSWDLRARLSRRSDIPGGPRGCTAVYQADQGLVCEGTWARPPAAHSLGGLNKWLSTPWAGMLLPLPPHTHGCHDLRPAPKASWGMALPALEALLTAAAPLPQRTFSLAKRLDPFGLDTI